MLLFSSLRSRWFFYFDLISWKSIQTFIFYLSSWRASIISVSQNYVNPKRHDKCSNCACMVCFCPGIDLRSNNSQGTKPLYSFKPLLSHRNILAISMKPQSTIQFMVHLFARDWNALLYGQTVRLNRSTVRRVGERTCRSFRYQSLRPLFFFILSVGGKLGPKFKFCPDS